MERLAYSVKEFCQLVGLGRATTYRRIKDGSLQVRRIGGRTLIPASEVARLLSGDGASSESDDTV